jgi:transketolase
MINPDAKLVDGIFEGKFDKKPTRDGLGNGTVEAGKLDPNVVVLSADLGDSTRAAWFQKAFPDRFIEVSVAEQNLATVASGMAHLGKIPFIASYAAFSPGRSWEQIRTTVALNDVPVKVCGMHAGIQTGPDGATHQMLEDIAMMRAMPNMIVIVPSDAEEGKKAVMAAAKNGKPTYLRFGRANEPVLTTPETPFEVGKALKVWESKDPKVAILVTGSLLYQALVAAKKLDEAGTGSIVLDVHTVKPLDREAIIGAAKQAGAVVTVEEHQINGGFGGAVAELLGEECPTRMVRLGIPDKFGQSGEPDELVNFYGLNADGVIQAVEKVLKK